MRAKRYADLAKGLESLPATKEVIELHALYLELVSLGVLSTDDPRMRRA